MTGIPAFLARFRAEDAVDVIGVARQGIQQGTFAGGLEMGDCRFHEMTGAVQLVPVTQVGPALLRFDRSEMGVEIAIGLLSCENQSNDLVNPLREPRVGMSGETIAGGLKPLGDIRIPEDVGNRFSTRFPVKAKSIETASFLTEPVEVRQGMFTVGAKTRCPKEIVDGYVFPGNRCEC